MDRLHKRDNVDKEPKTHFPQITTHSVDCPAGDAPLGGGSFFKHCGTIGVMCVSVKESPQPETKQRRHGNKNGTQMHIIDYDNTAINWQWWWLGSSCNRLPTTQVQLYSHILRYSRRRGRIKYVYRMWVVRRSTKNEGGYKYLEKPFKTTLEYWSVILPPRRLKFLPARVDLIEKGMSIIIHSIRTYCKRRIGTRMVATCEWKWNWN